MLIYDALKNDHEKARKLVNQLIGLNEGDEGRSQVIQQIRDELIPHARAEEAVFYNSIRAVRTAQDLVWHGYEEHMEVEGYLRTLQAADKIDADFKKIAQKMKKALEHHIREEETRIIPIAQQLFTREEAEVMAETYEKMKPEVKEGSFMQNTLDMIANMLPPRLAAPMRTFSLRA